MSIEQGPLRRGERVFIARPTSADAAELARSARLSRSLHDGLVKPPLEARAVRQMFENDAQAANERLVVRVTDGGEIVGVYNISNIIRGPFLSAFLGYYAFSQWAGKGLMAEGLRLVLDHAFGPLKLHRLEANIQPHNQRSIGLVRRCGFREEGFSPRYLKVAGRWRDHLRFAILAEDWRKQRHGGGRLP